MADFKYPEQAGYKGTWVYKEQKQREPSKTNWQIQPEQMTQIQLE
jgi:hypothetical protein